MSFPIITKQKQSLYEEIVLPKLSETREAYIPEICGLNGRACRQMGSLEGANRVLCSSCSLAEFCKKLTVKDIPLPENKIEIYEMDNLGMMHTIYEGKGAPDWAKDRIVQHFNSTGNGTVQVRI